jgi:alkyldihydroxyacetonephosphate synthase
MKRWNGWGDEKNNFNFKLTPVAKKYIENITGTNQHLAQASLDEVINKVPQSKAPAHPLINTDPELRIRHSRGQSIPDWIAMKSGEFGTFTDGVAFPENTEQVKALLALAKEQNFIVIPYGGGTSVCGHINPENSDAKAIISVSMAKMNKLMAIDKESQIATFGAGTLGPDIEKQLAEHGFTLGHFPQSWELSTIGGWVASRSSGQQSLRYGRIEKMFAGGKIETLQGTLDIPTFPASSAGPDIREIILGSEGRIGIITEVKVRITKISEHESFHVAFFPSWEIGIAATRNIVQSGVQLSMMRLSNAKETSSHLKLAGHERAVSLMEKYLKFRGCGEGKTMFTYGITGTKLQCKSALKQVKQLISTDKGINIGTVLGKHWEHSRFRSPYLREGLWEVGLAVDTMETCVDWPSVPCTVKQMEADIGSALHGHVDTDLKNINENIHVFSHLSHFYGQGCSVYTTYVFRMGDNYKETMSRWEKLKAAGAKAIVNNGGTISHQHGVGTDHKPYLSAEKGELGIRTIQGLCKAFDPEKRMNPGKLVD